MSNLCAMYFTNGDGDDIRFDNSEQEKRGEFTRGESITVLASVTKAYAHASLSIILPDADGCFPLALARARLACLFTTAVDEPEEPDSDEFLVQDLQDARTQNDLDDVDPAILRGDSDAPRDGSRTRGRRRREIQELNNIPNAKALAVCAIEAEAAFFSVLPAEGSSTTTDADAILAVAPATDIDTTYVALEVLVLAIPAPAPVDASTTAALVSETATSPAPAIEIQAASLDVPPANVAVPAAIFPSKYLSSADELMSVHKAAHWNETPNKKFGWDTGFP
ncbi:hypothetical protein FIBSPDRAFT_931903 [Athelia psychrophila]|uniref:Uncharacterized protein n=1 Tax=Athelia psychrophila TaxID=1759441 RepID=A0A166JPM7_9AGAM|nr:hypothetical protein FIBSPDRAFT_931903 [Fibularhizoctonia sp. CBS 109695]